MSNPMTPPVIRVGNVELREVAAGSYESADGRFSVYQVKWLGWRAIYYQRAHAADTVDSGDCLPSAALAASALEQRLRGLRDALTAVLGDGEQGGAT